MRFTLGLASLQLTPSSTRDGTGELTLTSVCNCLLYEYICYGRVYYLLLLLLLQCSFCTSSTPALSVLFIMSVCCCYCCFCCCYCCRTRTRFLVSQACQVQYFVYLVLNRTDCLARQRYTKRVSSLARALNKPRSGSWLPACLTWSVSEYGSGSESVSVSLCLAVALALGPGA